MPAVAVLGGISALGAGASIYSANKSAKATERASNQATAISREQFERGIQEVAPFKQLGVNALPALEEAAISGASPFSFRDPSQYLANYYNSPEYETLNAQATDQILRGRSATGGLRSGGANVDLAKIAPMIGIDALARTNSQDLEQYGVNQGAINDRFNRLFGIAGMGANVATGNQTAGANFASQAGSNAIQAGRARAEAYANYGGAINSLAGDVGSIYTGKKFGII